MNFIASLLYTIATSVLLGLILGFQHGSLDRWAALLSLSGGVAVGIVACWRGCRSTALPRLRGWAWLPVVIFCLFSLRAFLWLIFREGDELRVLSPNNLGDMALHLTFINYFANGAPFWPDSPIFSQGKLTYAAGMDLFNSMLALVGVDITRGLIWTSLLGALATGVALLRWGRAFAMLGFLCNGGLTGFACLFTLVTELRQHVWQENGGFAGFACLFTGPGQAFFQDYQADWAWKNLPLAVLVTQRGFHFALPAGLLLLSSWRSRFFPGGKGWKLPFGGELLLYAAMPFFHLHTFLALSFMLAAFFVARAPARKQIAGLAAAAFIPATLLVYLTVGMFQTNAEPMWQDMSQFERPPKRPPVEALGWQPGWMVNDEATGSAWAELTANAPAAEPFAGHGRFLLFWFGNFGLLPLLLVPLVLALLRPLLRREVSAIKIWICVVGAIAVTPLLGGWDGYQRKSLGTLLAGNRPHAGVWSGLFTVLAIGAGAAGVFLHSRRTRDFGLRWVLSAVAGLYILDRLLVAFHASNSRIPLLPANATPLVLATFAFGVLLWRISQHAEDGMWSATVVLSALYLFFLCCNVKFATWDWDNTKLMLWAYLLILPFLWDLLIVRWKPLARAIVCVLLFFSGFVSLFGGFNVQPGGYSIAQLSKLDALAESVRDIPVTATFAAQPTYNHPLLLLGRKLVMGFEGHLGSHGIAYHATSAELDALMNGSAEWRLIAARLGARYLFFGPEERGQWPDSFQSWRIGAQLIASGEWGELFDLETPPLPLDESQVLPIGKSAPTPR